MAGRAQIRHENTLRIQPGIRQLVARGRPSIEKPVAIAPRRRKTRHRRIPWCGCRGLMEPPIQLLVSRSLTRERVAHLRTNFVAACSNRWSGHRDQIAGPGATLAAKGGDRDARYTRDKPPPTCVGRGDNSGSTIGQKQRHTIGDPNRDGDGGL
jgi:hypothetical protein